MVETFRTEQDLRDSLQDAADRAGVYQSTPAWDQARGRHSTPAVLAVAAAVALVAIVGTAVATLVDDGTQDSGPSTTTSPTVADESLHAATIEPLAPAAIERATGVGLADPTEQQHEQVTVGQTEAVDIAVQAQGTRLGQGAAELYVVTTTTYAGNPAVAPPTLQDRLAWVVTLPSVRIQGHGPIGSSPLPEDTRGTPVVFVDANSGAVLFGAIL